MLRLTPQLYEMYARRVPAEAHQLLTHYDTGYIFLEDSICPAPPKDGCRLTDILDLDNSMVGQLP